MITFILSYKSKNFDAFEHFRYKTQKLKAHSSKMIAKEEEKENLDWIALPKKKTFWLLLPLLDLLPRNPRYAGGGKTLRAREERVREMEARQGNERY